MCTDNLVCQFSNRSLSDSASAGQDAKLARYAACKRQLLFDQKHGEPFFLI